jgi:hypothetical protein
MYGPAFTTNATEAEQAALLTTYYKQGLHKLLEHHPNFVPNPDGSVSPSPTSKGGFDPLPDPGGGDGAPFVFRNFEKIKNAVSGKQGANTPPGDPAAENQQASVDLGQNITAGGAKSGAGESDTLGPGVADISQPSPAVPGIGSAPALRTALGQRAEGLGISYASYMPTSALLAAIHQQEAAAAQPHELSDVADRIEHEIDTIGLPLLQHPENDAPPPQGLAPLTRDAIGARADRLGIPYTAATPSDELLANIHSIDAAAAPPAAFPALADHIERDIDQMGALANLPGFSEEQEDA